MGKSSQKEEIIDRKKVLGNILKWVFILGLLIFGCVKNEEFMKDAIVEVADMPGWKLVVCLLLANVYFVAEGTIISRMTSTGGAHLTIGQGISCAYMCAFYRLATLGSGNGIAQLYYYNTKGISVSAATGMSVAQYTFQKITIGVMGVVSFLCLILFADRSLLRYSGYMLAGVVVISLICLFLFIITVSKKISDLLMMLVRKIIKEKSRLYPKIDQLQSSIDNLQNQGRLIWHDKKLFAQVVLLDLLKFSCWYIIPGVLFVKEFDVNLFMCMALMAVCNMLGCVMIAPSGVGTLDFVFAVFFGSIIPEGDYVAAAIVLYRFFTWVVPFLIGLIPAAFLKKKKPGSDDVSTDYS